VPSPSAFSRVAGWRRDGHSIPRPTKVRTHRTSSPSCRLLLPSYWESLQYVTCFPLLFISLSVLYPLYFNFQMNRNWWSISITWHSLLFILCCLPRASTKSFASKVPLNSSRNRWQWDPWEQVRTIVIYCIFFRKTQYFDAFQCTLLRT
jgi:hypothetical protein